MTNDSFGPGPVNEWDDLDSFGLRFSMPIDGVRLLAAISGLTDRTDTIGAGNRIDEASLGAAFSILAASPVWLSVAAGLDAIGDFGGLLVQEGFHADTGVARPVPTHYSGGFTLSPLGAFKLLAVAETPFSPYLVIAGRGSIPVRGSLLAVAGLRYDRPGTLLAISGGCRAVGGVTPDSTVATLDAAENGPYLGFEFRVGLLALAFEDMLGQKKTNGSLGIVIGRPLRSAPDSRPIALDLGLQLASSVAQRVRLSTELQGSEKGFHTDAFFSFTTGWFPNDIPEATLFWEYSAGGALSLPIVAGIVHVDFGLGPFISFEQLSTDTVVHSVPLGNRDTLGLAADAGIRVAIPISVPLGAGVRVRWRAIQGTFLQTGDSFLERSRFDFEIFVFSED